LVLVKRAFAACGQTMMAVWLILQAAARRAWLPGTMTLYPPTVWLIGFARRVVNAAIQNIPMFQGKNTGIITWLFF
jgi:hypothetical protein